MLSCDINKNKMLNTTDYSNTIIATPPNTGYYNTTCIAYGTNIYYCKDISTLTIITNAGTYDVTTTANFTGAAMAITPDGSKLFIGTYSGTDTTITYAIVT